MLGSAVAGRAVERGHQVVGTYRTEPLDIPHVEMVKLDLTDPGDLARVVGRAAPELVVHSAAATDVDWCESNPEQAWQVNVRGAELVAEAARQASSRLIHVSTDAVFDGTGDAYGEGDVPAPINEYARTKLEAERRVLKVAQESVVARTNLFGLHPQRPSGLVHWLLRNVAAGSVIGGFTDVRFNPLYVPDLASLLLDIADTDAGGVLHVAAGSSMTKFEFARRVAEAFGYDPELVEPRSVDSMEFAAARPRTTVLEIATLRAYLPASSAVPTLEAGIDTLSSDPTAQGWKA